MDTRTQRPAPTAPATVFTLVSAAPGPSCPGASPYPDGMRLWLRNKQRLSGDGR